MRRGSLAGSLHAPLVVHQLPRHLEDGSGAGQDGSKQLGCGQMGPTLMGPLPKEGILKDCEKGTPWHFWEDKIRLTGVPKKTLQKAHFLQ